jgi:hypothetical protein
MSENEVVNQQAGGSEDVTLIFEPQSGGSVQEREPKTHTLRQFVTAVFQRLNVTNAVNPMVQKKGGSSVLDLNATVAALGLDSGDKLNLAWQASGGMG